MTRLSYVDVQSNTTSVAGGGSLYGIRVQGGHLLLDHVNVTANAPVNGTPGGTSVGPANPPPATCVPGDGATPSSAGPGTGGSKAYVADGITGVSGGIGPVGVAGHSADKRRAQRHSPAPHACRARIP